MKSNFLYKNCIYLLVILIFGVFSPLFSVAGISKQGLITKNSFSTNQIRTVQVIEAKLATPSELLNSSVNSSVTGQSFGCMPAKSLEGNLIQNQPVMDLNQPASCFKLAVANENAVSSQKISVAIQSSSRPMVVVARWPAQTIGRFKLNTSPLPPTQPVPVQVYGFVAVSLAGFKLNKIVQKITRRFFVQFTGQSGLLMVMRC